MVCLPVSLSWWTQISYFRNTIDNGNEASAITRLYLYDLNSETRTYRMLPHLYACRASIHCFQLFTNRLKRGLLCEFPSVLSEAFAERWIVL
jgi:hypothetical protein